jgi:hypothetical protein
VIILISHPIYSISADVNEMDNRKAQKEMESKGTVVMKEIISFIKENFEERSIDLWPSHGSAQHLSDGLFSEVSEDK